MGNQCTRRSKHQLLTRALSTLARTQTSSAPQDHHRCPLLCANGAKSSTGSRFTLLCVRSRSTHSISLRGPVRQLVFHPNQHIPPPPLPLLPPRVFMAHHHHLMTRTEPLFAAVATLVRAVHHQRLLQARFPQCLLRNVYRFLRFLVQRLAENYLHLLHLINLRLLFSPGCTALDHHRGSATARQLRFH